MPVIDAVLWDKRLRICSCGLLACCDLFFPELGWGFISVSCDQTVSVIQAVKVDQRQAKFLNGLEVPELKQVFLEGTNEAFSDAVAFGFTHEGRRCFDVQKENILGDQRRSAWSRPSG